MTSFTRTWGAAYEATPADSDLLTEGAARIRDAKEDTQERGVVDHSWAGDSSDGEHKKVTFFLQTGDPATVVDKGYLYTKDVSSTIELFWKDEAGNVTQLTSGGSLLLKLLELSSDPAAVTNSGFLYTKDDGGDTELYYEDDGGAVVQLTKDGAINTTFVASSETVSGIIELATQAETDTGTDDLRVVTPKKLAGMTGNLPNADFVSSEQTVTANTLLDVAHSLSAKPSLFTAILICKTAEHNYSVGDEVLIGSIVEGSPTRGAVMVVDTTNVSIVQGAAISLLNKTTFAVVNITAASWKWVIRAWK